MSTCVQVLDVQPLTEDLLRARVEMAAESQSFATSRDTLQGNPSGTNFGRRVMNEASTVMEQINAILGDKSLSKKEKKLKLDAIPGIKTRLRRSINEAIISGKTSLNEEDSRRSRSNSRGPRTSQL